MMRIAYQTPAQSQGELQRAAAATRSMQALVAQLTRAGSQPSNKYGLLSKADRMRLREEGYSATLINSVAFFTEQVRLPQGDGFVEKNELMVGFTSDAFDSNLYATDSIKDALIQSHRGRCAYCETLIHHAAYGDVEHFRPKAAYTTPWSPALFRPAYYFLAYEPTNLFYACQLCNQAYKKNEFPVIGDRAPQVTVGAEAALLLNPYAEDPRASLRFNPLNGYAYPFDLVQTFYAAANGWGPPQTSAEIWKDPSKIPGQRDYQGLLISNSKVDEAFQQWLTTVQVQNPMLQRGNRTIVTLGLNRRALVRARVSHLRQLRALVWAGVSGTGSDQAAANALIAALVNNDPAAPSIAPEYVSLSIDALQTWNNQGAANFSWIDTYNKVLNAFVPHETLIAPAPSNDALSHLILEEEMGLAGRRRVVYVSGSDKVYGNPPSARGIFLSIDWEDELENTVLVVRDNKLRQEMKLIDLVNLLDSKPSAYNIFRNSELWIVGDYPPFVR